MGPNSPAPAANRAGARWIFAVEALLVWLVFAAQAGWPPPDPNEAHYLGKARHYWSPEWVPGDFFFDSADTHQVFYLLCGGLSRVLTLEAFAWCGRVVTWLLLAAAFVRLCRSLAIQFGGALLAATIFLTLNVCCHLAGEWVVGGFEAKGLAYALVLLALSALVRERWSAVWWLLGAASALHVLVGGWSAVAVGVSWLLSGSTRPPLKQMAPHLIAGFVISLAGLVPALALNWNVDAATMAEANHIYVFRRLRHHLAPQDLPPWLLARHLLLLAGWAWLCRKKSSTRGVRALRGFVVGALVIELLGLAIAAAAPAIPELATALLRFYWFRLADMAIPLGVAIELVVRWETTARRMLFLALLVAGCLALAGANSKEFFVFNAQSDRPRGDRPGKVLDHEDWKSACHWARDHTSRKARFLTPRLAQTFKWHAHRSEVVSWKDIPQDAPDILHWWQRLLDVHGLPVFDGEVAWHASLTELEPDRLRALGSKYQAEYLLTEASPAIPLKRLYQNDSYAVYALTADASIDADEDRPNDPDADPMDADAAIEGAKGGP